MSNINYVGVKGWYIKTKPSIVFFPDINALVSLENTFIPLSRKNFTVNQNNSSGIKCSDEYGGHAHQN